MGDGFVPLPESVVWQLFESPPDAPEFLLLSGLTWPALLPVVVPSVPLLLEEVPGLFDPLAPPELPPLEAPVLPFDPEPLPEDDWPMADVARLIDKTDIAKILMSMMFPRFLCFRLS